MAPTSTKSAAIAMFRRISNFGTRTLLQTEITGGKVFAIFTLLGALGGAAWTGFTFYQDYLTMKEKILEYTEPDLSGFDKKIALIERR